VKYLHIFSDACPGQTRNNPVVKFLLALVQTKNLQTVSHYFSIRGHSYLPSDRNFAVIKRKLKIEYKL
jgi:hypothetical protein